jgi:ABC-type glycerol-3-phosphate transport system permease component
MTAVQRRRLQVGGTLLLALPLLGFALFPLLWILDSSFKSLGETHTYPPSFVPSQWTLDPYFSVLGQHDFLKYMTHSFVVAVITTLWGVLVAAWSAYGFARFDFPGKWAALVFVLLAQSFPRILLIIPYFQMASAAHLVDTYPALILAYSTFIQPLCLWIMKAYVEQLPRELDEAALVDGCNHYSVFWRVILPLLRPALAATAIFGFLTAWNEYEFALVLTRTEVVRTISVALNYFLGEFTTEWNNIMAAAALATLPVVIIFLFLQRQLVQGLTGGAVKG